MVQGGRMSEVYKRFAVVVADLERMDITNEDQMRYSKRCCVNAARSALEDGVRRAEEMLRLVDNIQSDVNEVVKEKK